MVALYHRIVYKSTGMVFDLIERHFMTWYKESQVKDGSEIVFRDENRGFHHGQSDNTLIAYSPPGNPVGYLEYSIYDGEVSVQYLHVAEDKRRNGFGKALLLELQKRNPGIGIDLGMSSKEGSALIESMKREYIPNQEYGKLKKEEESLKDRIQALNDKRDAWHLLTEEEKNRTRPALLADGEEWNKINDRLWEIEKELLYMKPGKSLLVG